MAANGYLTTLKRGEHQELINSEAQVPAGLLDLHHALEQNELFPKQNDAGVVLSPVRWIQYGGVFIPAGYNSSSPSSLLSLLRPILTMSSS